MQMSKCWIRCVGARCPMLYLLVCWKTVFGVFIKTQSAQSCFIFLFIYKCFASCSRFFITYGIGKRFVWHDARLIVRLVNIGLHRALIATRSYRKATIYPWFEANLLSAVTNCEWVSWLYRVFEWREWTEKETQLSVLSWQGCNRHRKDPYVGSHRLNLGS